eukprot:TRINITY_DN25977_c0_g1_i2.p1 TRINITY_DN25977_c0_g1~~TRINITY_DN25977_c0_g1_i2.p1  ORF type:complete len:162 (-),score=5.23 TRINITY_DN25977_c0_g1_i2:120-578(-)
MIRRPPRSTLSSSSAASDVYKRQLKDFTIPSCSFIIILIGSSTSAFKSLVNFNDCPARFMQSLWNACMPSPNVLALISALPLVERVLCASYSLERVTVFELAIHSLCKELVNLLQTFATLLCQILCMIKIVKEGFSVCFMCFCHMCYFYTLQ